MKKHIFSILFLLCGIFLYGQEYVVISPNSLSVPQSGGTYTCSVDYAPSPDSLMSWDLSSYTSTSGQVSSVTNGSDKQFTVTFGANTGYSPVSGSVTVYYPDPQNWNNRVWGTLSFSQAGQTADYSISVSPTTTTISPNGGTQQFTVTYKHLPGPFTLTYLGATGLPDGCTLTAGGNGVLTLTCNRNTTGSARTGTVTVRYRNPQNASLSETASFTFTQPTLSYALALDPASLYPSPTSGQYMIGAEITGLDSAYVISYRGVDGLPPGASLEVMSERYVRITFATNTTGSTLQGTILLSYSDPFNSSLTLTAGLAYQQPTYDPPISTTGAVTERSYRTANGTGYNTTVTYLDGLGRPLQTVQAGASPTGGDLIGFLTYDCMGRSDSVNYLPYARTGGTAGACDANPTASQLSYYTTKFGAANAPYASGWMAYDKGLGLVSAQGSPGTAHRISDGYYTRYAYRLNTDADAIVRYVVLSNGSLQSQGNYGANQLTVRRIINTQNNNDSQRQESLEYTDALGRTIASEVRISSSDRRITYYVYDNLGRQRYLLPPMADTFDCTSPKTAQELNKYCYYSEYDRRGLVTRSQNPGAEYLLSLYDRKGRLSMSQNGRQRTSNQWSFTKYDALDRPILSGVTTGGTYASHKAALDGATLLYETRGSAVHGYTNSCYPSVADANSYLSVTYYDDYNWLAANDPHAFSSTDALGQTLSPSVRGLVTGTKSKVLGISTHQWLTSATYYDQDYRTIQSVADLYPAGIEITANTHDFTGLVTQTKVKQTLGGKSYEYNKWFAYDNFGRLLSVQQQITGDAANGKVTLAAYTYDALGKPASKKIHNSLQTETYAYDIAGRVIGVSSPSFSYALDYEQTSLPDATARLDGNISALKWGDSATPNKAYAYHYDPVGQLAAACYKTAAGGTWSNSAAYAEQNLSYDRHGNLKTLLRTNASGTTLHNLTDMTYDGNRLQSLKLNGASAGSYSYDQNGNMTTDGRRGVTINYNILNFPEKIVAGNQNVAYIYSASGEKLATNANGSLTYYRSVMVYGNDNMLLYLLTPEGTVSCTNGAYTYNYFKKDQVGSTRVMLSAVGGTLQQQQTTDYYPFGLAHATNNLNKNKILFSGKELQDATVGGAMLGLYDFGARSFDPMIGRWTTIDLYAKKYPAVSPYVYCLNDPINLIDLIGLEPTKDSMPDGKGGWIYIDVYNLDGPTIVGTPSERNSPTITVIGSHFGDQLPVPSDWMDKIDTPNSDSDSDSGGGGSSSITKITSSASIATALAQIKSYSDLLGKWTGKNGKTYSTRFNGNGRTGGKYQFGRTVSGYFKKAGNALAAFGIGLTAINVLTGRQNGIDGGIDALSGMATVWGGEVGVAWGIGWEAGRMITNTDWYQEMKFDYWQGQMEDLIGTPNQTNQPLWNDFYNNYRNDLIQKGIIKK